MAPIKLAYSIVDVFTRERFSGNQVAVIHDARAISQDQMQNIAREFGFSETTFILPPTGTQYLATVRIFTPHEEIPFAGHPNIGTAFVIGAQQTAARAPLTDSAVFDELGGDVPVKPIREGAVVVGAQIKAPQSFQILGKLSPDLMAECLGLSKHSLMIERTPPCVASVGLPFAFVEFTGLDALGAIAPDLPAFQRAADDGPRTVDGFAICAFVVLAEKDGEFTVRSRVICPLGHPAEDPATGSASGALASLLAETSGRNDATFKITQGVEMGRRSEIEVDVAPDGGVTIRGYCVAVSTGTMLV